MQTSLKFQTVTTLGSGEAAGEELCLRCKMRICWETHELKVV